MQTASTAARPARVLAVYHRAETFGGSFNSVLDVLSRVDRDRFAVAAAVPGPGNVEAAFQRLRIPVHVMAERPGARTPRYAVAVAAAWLSLRRYGADLVYVTDYVTWRSSVITAARLAGMPSVVHVRTPLGPEALDPELLRSTMVLGNSAATLRSLVQHRPSDTTRVVHNFVDVARFAAAADRRLDLFGGTPPVIGFLGVFRPEKGIEVLPRHGAAHRGATTGRPVSRRGW